MKCTRCKKVLKEGINIRSKWHVPICRNCRITLFENYDFSLTDEEKEIMQERFKEERK